jgi:hypothetical protein
MSQRHLLTLLGLVLIGIGLFERGWFLLAVWFGCDFLVLAIAHARRAHRVFGKRPDGSIPFWSWLVFLPLLLYASAVWHIARLLSRESAHNEVTNDLIVGRRLLPGELDGDFANYVDLTSEFAEPLAIHRSAAYLCFPILDGSAQGCFPQCQAASWHEGYYRAALTATVSFGLRPQERHERQHRTAGERGPTLT